MKQTMNIDEQATSSQGADFHVLLVDDEPINRHILSAMLKRLNCAVIDVANGKLALDAASRTTFDLIFMDIQMPEMDGIEATQLIRNSQAYSRNSSTPIIALTAYAIPGEDSGWLRAGMNGHLAKPVTLKAMQEIITLHLPD